MTAPLVAYDRELLATMGPEIAETQSRTRVQARELADCEAKLAKATGRDERARRHADVQVLAVTVRAAPAPAEPRVLTSEATPEAVARGLAE